MTQRKWLPDLLLLLTAALWGFAFIAQRQGMDAMGPFTFNGVRFLMGAFTLWIVTRIFPRLVSPAPKLSMPKFRNWWPALLTGLVLFGGASLQQVGLVHTDAGKAGFITGMYVVLVPILGLFVCKRTDAANWAGAGLAAIGLYLLTVSGNFRVAPSDILVLMGAFLWAIHVHLIASFAPRIGAVRLAIIQFLVCGVLSLGAALTFEAPSLGQLGDGIWALLYGSILSVGLAYSLQVVAQQWASPTHAAIILSLEGVFAALGGWIILNENLGWRGLIGAGVMLLGMLVSQKVFGRNKG